jgi:hypothetical protein
MKVFISWSGESSKCIASFLHDWLPTVIQIIKPYMSAENIDKGERWSVDIANQLQETNFGIICVTPENIDAPWILFESGALSKSIQNSRVSPIMFGLNPSDFTKSPLLQFQLTAFTKDDILKLLTSINNSAPEEGKVRSDVLNKSFARAWPELEAAIGGINLKKSPNLNIRAVPGEVEPAGSISTPFLEQAIQEILTNTRSQIKILKSPSELLPPSYVSDILLKSRFRSHPPLAISVNHMAWKHIETSNEFFRSLLENLESQIDGEGASITLDHIAKGRHAAERFKTAFDYIRAKLYGMSRTTQHPIPDGKPDTIRTVE